MNKFLCLSLCLAHNFILPMQNTLDPESLHEIILPNRMDEEEVYVSDRDVLKKIHLIHYGVLQHQSYEIDYGGRVVRGRELSLALDSLQYDLEKIEKMNKGTICCSTVNCLAGTTLGFCVGGLLTYIIMAAVR